MSGNALGRWLFASAIVAFGLLHLFYGDFVTRVVPWWPDWIPGRTAWAALTGVALVAAGAALAADWRTRQVGVWLGVLLVVSFLLLGVPAAAADSALGRMWTRAGKALALGG